MRPNLWIYSEKSIISQTAYSLKLFGAKIFYEAKIIKELDLLENIIKGIDDDKNNPDLEKLNEFFFSHLIDIISILIFFENYMKAELIVRGYCVYQINKEISKFKDIAKRQFKEPIEMSEIEAIEPFEFNVDKKEIFHRGLKETTIGLKELTSKNYLDIYQLDKEVVNYINALRIVRNGLHFYPKITFSMSMEEIIILKKIKLFADKVLS